MPQEPGTLLDQVACVRCAAVLDISGPSIECSRCAQVYSRVGRIPVLLPRPDDHVTLWRQQLAALGAQGEHTLQAIETELGSVGFSPSGHARLTALSRALSDQVQDIARSVGPALGGPLEGGTGALPRGVVEYIQFLYRDWGWDSADQHENEQALAAIRQLVAPGALGQTLVIGAGACRLAYDLHRQLGASETAVIDIDPFLFVIAEAVVRGEPVQLTESTANVQELSQVARTWLLRAPGAPLGGHEFHFFLANGLAPPFADHSFDTVVTPWFIDQVPGDLLAFFERLSRLLKPGGRWINSGPLLYPPDMPLARRYSREEVFELAERAGFVMDAWSGESRPHLESPLNGRGKIEWVLTFVASSRASATEPSAAP
jgi:SAM-dependent methyltransferase